MTISKPQRVFGISRWLFRRCASPNCGPNPSQCVQQHETSDSAMSLSARRGTRQQVRVACFVQKRSRTSQPAWLHTIRLKIDEQAVRRDYAPNRLNRIPCIAILLRSSACRHALCITAPSAPS